MPYKSDEARRQARRAKYLNDPEYRAKILASNRRWEKENPEKKREISRRSHQKHREKRNAYSLAYTKAHPEKGRLARRKLWGIQNATGEQKSGPCEICQMPTAALHYDHDHATGAFRGWLCKHCNWGLGQFQDRPDLLIAAAEYLRAPRR